MAVLSHTCARMRRKRACPPPPACSSSDAIVRTRARICPRPPAPSPTRVADTAQAEGLPTETTFREGEDFDVNEKDGAVTVPKDHPFASAAELTKEEQEKIRRALEPRRRGRAAAAARAGDEEDE